MSDLVKHEEKTKYNEKQTGSSVGSDTTVVTQSESGDQTGNSKRVSETARSLTGKTTATTSNRERVNIGVQISFSVPIRTKTPVPAGTSC